MYIPIQVNLDLLFFFFSTIVLVTVLVPFKVSTLYRTTRISLNRFAVKVRSSSSLQLYVYKSLQFKWKAEEPERIEAR